MFADQALQVCTRMDIDTVLDIGCGNGVHSEAFIHCKKTVTSVDIGSLYPKAIRGDFNTLHFENQKFDLIWASHVLEHQLNVHNFLSKCRSLQNPGSFIAITVPPLKHEIVGGHVTLWNPGLLMYNLVLAGYNCSKARVKQYGYNISVIAEADTFELDNLKYDYGDIEAISKWLPYGYNYQGFNGNIQEFNWPKNIS
jgi:SAM-dependent methyltransferase